MIVRYNIRSGYPLLMAVVFLQLQIIASHIIKVHASADATLGEHRASKEENWLKR